MVPATTVRRRTPQTIFKSRLSACRPRRAHGLQGLRATRGTDGRSDHPGFSFISYTTTQAQDPTSFRTVSLFDHRDDTQAHSLCRLAPSTCRSPSLLLLGNIIRSRHELSHMNLRMTHIYTMRLGNNDSDMNRGASDYYHQRSCTPSAKLWVTGRTATAVQAIAFFSDEIEIANEG